MTITEDDATELLGAKLVERRKTPAIKPCILVDDREKTPWTFSGNVDRERVHLDTADYSVRGFSDKFIVERKSLEDFVMCCGQERARFVECIERMAGYERPWLIIEASVDDAYAGAYRSAMNPLTVVNTALSIAMTHRIQVFWAGDARNAAKAMEWLAFRLLDPEKTPFKPKSTAI